MNLKDDPNSWHHCFEAGKVVIPQLVQHAPGEKCRDVLCPYLSAAKQKTKAA
jgi:hypothetical protein